MHFLLIVSTYSGICQLLKVLSRNNSHNNLKGLVTNKHLFVTLETAKALWLQGARYRD